MKALDQRTRIALAAGLGLAVFTLALLLLRFAPPGVMRRDAVGDRRLTLAVPEAERGPRRSVDGVRVAQGQQENPRLLVVIVENMVDARPASGLSAASLVFEAPVEAGITRLLAVYPADVEVPEIGPVRSSRPYFDDWVAELDALYAHVGGSPGSLSRIRALDLLDLNEFSFGRYYWRSSRRPRPHNVYTSTAVLGEALADRGIAATSTIDRWIFKDDAPPDARGSIQEIVIPFSSPAYTATWRFDLEQNVYRRFQDGSEHRDRDGAEVVAKNVAVVFTDVEVIDEVGRRRIRTAGEGKARVFLDGRAFEATWRKASARDRLRFYLEDGIEIEWNAGQTWIEVVSERTDVAVR